MKMKRILMSVLISVFVLAGCAMTPNSSNVYSSYQAQGEQNVRFGVVESVRNVVINYGQTGVGTVGGAVIGGLAGSTIGQGRGSIAGAVGGAIVGGLIGQQVEKSANNRAGLEITVRLDDGRLVAVTQDADVPFYPGDQVRLLSEGGVTRVTH
jgi:outer membrane lipoprotein SlyB